MFPRLLPATRIQREEADGGGGGRVEGGLSDTTMLGTSSLELYFHHRIHSVLSLSRDYNDTRRKEESRCRAVIQARILLLSISWL